MDKRYLAPLIHVTCHFSIYKYITKIGEKKNSSKIFFIEIFFLRLIWNFNIIHSFRRWLTCRIWFFNLCLFNGLYRLPKFWHLLETCISGGKYILSIGLKIEDGYLVQNFFLFQMRCIFGPYGPLRVGIFKKSKKYENAEIRVFSGIFAVFFPDSESATEN